GRAVGGGRAAARARRGWARLLPGHAGRPARAARIAPRAARTLGRPRVEAGDAVTRGEAPQPPPAAERLLVRALAGAVYRDDIVGDLHEDFAAIAATRGPTLARLWYVPPVLP